MRRIRKYNLFSILFKKKSNPFTDEYIYDLKVESLIHCVVCKSSIDVPNKIKGIEKIKCKVCGKEYRVRK